MCNKPFSQTKNKGKQFLVAKSSGPLLARMPLKRVLDIMRVKTSHLKGKNKWENPGVNYTHDNEFIWL